MKTAFFWICALFFFAYLTENGTLRYILTMIGMMGLWMFICIAIACIIDSVRQEFRNAVECAVKDILRNKYNVNS